MTCPLVWITNFPHVFSRYGATRELHSLRPGQKRVPAAMQNREAPDHDQASHPHQLRAEQRSCMGRIALVVHPKSFYTARYGANRRQALVHAYLPEL